MRLLAILTLAGCLYPSGQPTLPTVPAPARLIDVHVHIWSTLPADPRFQQSLVAAFDRYHVHRAVVSGPYEFVPGAVSLAPQQLLGGAIYGAGIELPPATTVRMLIQTNRVAVLGEIDAAWRGEALDTAALDPYWQLAEASEVPAFVFTGVAPPGTANQACCPKYRNRFGHPEQLEDVLNKYPKLRVNLVQAGWPYRTETIALMHSYPQVYADIGNLAGNPAIPREEFHDYLHALVRAGLGKRLMFGSGLSIDEWPDKIGTVIAAVNEVPFLTAEQRDDIFYNNAARFLRYTSQRPGTSRYEEDGGRRDGRPVRLNDRGHR